MFHEMNPARIARRVRAAPIAVTATPVIPPASKTATPATIAVFALVHAISFIAPLMRVKVEPPANAPLVSARAVADFASATGAACTEFVATAPAITVTDCVTPRRRKNFRNLSSAHDMYTAISTNAGKTFGPALKLGTGTWPLNGCPMDGGALAGSWSVWRRGATVYYTEGLSGECLLGQGKQPIVSLGNDSPCFIWEDNSRLMLKRGSTTPIELTQNGAYPAMDVTADHVPIVVWETSVNGAQTIMADVLK